MLDGLLDLLSGADAELLRATHALRWDPADVLLLAVSAWWVKGPLYIAVGAARDLWARRPPVTALCVLLALALSSLLSTWGKQVFDRERPPEALGGVDVVGSLPASASFPSGHAATAFACATALAVLCPKLRLPALALAALIGVSRVYLGVHFWFDVLAGAALGAIVGFALARLAQRLQPAPAPALQAA